MFSSIIIANRGEIACRVAKTARKMGIRVIAVYSQADEGALHTKLADEAYYIGPAPANESYLCGDKILAIAKEAKAECLHPGYGFLSENADFAEQCASQGVTFVGPPASAIRAMGLKDQAKDLMQKAGVPVVPGYQGANQEAAFLKQKAYEIGYPVMIKAVAGGGGKGMRQVNTHAEFEDALIACQRESTSAFGDDKVLIEKFVTNPRHIEMQLFGDNHGNAVHLFERDCSLQRRHQKVIEEAPAPGINNETRKAMGKAAVAAAKAVGYSGAGTIEFIVDGYDGLKPDGFFFLEMNTRLQVEHPVTELITGFDLVEWQLRVAFGEKLPASQDEIVISDHSCEARVYAEDPTNHFLPQTGTLHRLIWPDESDVRIDTAVKQGDQISPFYDPMIAKIIVKSETRGGALVKLASVLSRTTLLGLSNNIGFLHALVTDSKFINGDFDTGFIDKNIDHLLPETSLSCQNLAITAWAYTHGKIFFGNSPWQKLAGWTLAGTERIDNLHLLVNGQEKQVSIHWDENGFSINGETAVSEIKVTDSKFSAVIDHKEQSGSYVKIGSKLYISTNRKHFEISAQDLLDRDELGVAGSSIVKAPMPGKVINIAVAQGDKVGVGDPLLVLEAMKMEHSLNAALEGVVGSMNVELGDQVEDGQVLVVLEPSEAE